MDKREIEEITKSLKDFVLRQEDKSFALNSDNEKVKRLIKGLAFNEEKYGLKFCPCRLTTGNKEEDLKLICPCNFKIQKTWAEKGECWCSLFVKADNIP